MATNKKWTITEGGGMFYAPYIPQFITKKEKVPMFLKLRKRFVKWLRNSDIYRDDGSLVNDDEEPIKLRANREVASWTNAVNVMSNTAKVRRAPKAVLGTSQTSDHIESIDARGITFKLFPARGGLVIETYHYDERSDSNQNTLHLIAEAEDLSEALARIITMEAARG